MLIQQDFMIDSVVLQSVVAPLPPTFGPGDQPYDPNALSTTYLSTQKLSAAGLSNLQIAANTTLTVTADANISMIPGATLSLAARAIDFQGKINIPSGTVNLTDLDNVTAFPTLFASGSPNPRYVPMDFSQIYLAQAAKSTRRGSASMIPWLQPSSGGKALSLTLPEAQLISMDESYFGQGVISAAGSLIDVSGGYGISRTGVVTGGNAGALSIQGNGIVLDGQFEGILHSGQ